VDIGSGISMPLVFWVRFVHGSYGGGGVSTCRVCEAVVEYRCWLSLSEYLYPRVEMEEEGLLASAYSLRTPISDGDGRALSSMNV
jgi:hypothetical protein